MYWLAFSQLCKSLARPSGNPLFLQPGSEPHFGCVSLLSIFCYWTFLFWICWFLFPWYGSDFCKLCRTWNSLLHYMIRTWNSLLHYMISCIIVHIVFFIVVTISFLLWFRSCVRFYRSNIATKFISECWFGTMILIGGPTVSVRVGDVQTCWKCWICSSWVATPKGILGLPLLVRIVVLWFLVMV